MRASTLAYALLCGLAASQALAQAPEQPASTLDAKQKSAAKIAGLVGFVNVSCDTLRTDPERFQSVLGGMGVAVADLDKGELMLTARSYVDAYRKDIPANCKRASEMFGPEGKVVPGLVLPK